MKVLLDHPRATVIHGRWQELPGSVGPLCDVVITDPPYTDHVHKNIRSCTTNGALKVRTWEPGFEPLTEYSHVDALLALANRWVVCFCALESFGEYVAAAGGHWKSGGHYVRSGIWRKQQAAPQLSGDRPANSCEGLAIMHGRDSGRLHWNGRGKHAFWRFEGEDTFVEHGRERAEKRHPAQKPLALMTELVSLFSDPGETVLDPFAGSGSTGMAALAAGRNVVLVEESEEWAGYCAARLAGYLET